MALDESMTDPPPTARMKSTPSLRHRSIPSAQADEVHAAVAEQPADLVQQAGLLGALAAVMDQNLVTAVLFHEVGHFFLGLLPEHDFGRGMIDEISHNQCVFAKLRKIPQIIRR